MRKLFLFLGIGILVFYSFRFTNLVNYEITEAELEQHISILASDSLQGRYPGEGGNLAADYIAYQMNNYGLNPLYNNGFQEFDLVTACDLGEKNFMSINGKELEIENDYMPFSFSSSHLSQAELVFVAYGFDINSDKIQWNDYNIDVKGKFVIILSGTPEPDKIMSAFTSFSSHRAKVALAKDKGAVGVLFVDGVNDSEEGEPRKLEYDQNTSDAGIPVISLSRTAANKIIGDLSIEKLEDSIISSNKTIVFDIDASVKAQTSVDFKVVKGKNVVFEIKNNDDADYIVIGAHYDHLGMGGQNKGSRMPDTNAVHNGADDNASGVAGVIELAGLFISKSEMLNKNIIFVAFDAEEMGLLGSKYFVDNLPIPKERISMMLNFDMIGRMKSDSAGISIGGIGTAKEFDSIMANHKSYFNVLLSDDGYGPSDHASFYAIDIPVLYVTTGAHADYHTPFDDIEFIKFDKQKDILYYVFDIIYDLAISDIQLSFESTQSAAPTNGHGRSSLKVTFGIIPDFAGVVKDGLGVDGVKKGGPAEKAGIKKGDKITAINSEKIENIYDYMFRLSKLKKGTTAILELERDGEILVLLIQL